MRSRRKTIALLTTVAVSTVAVPTAMAAPTNYGTPRVTVVLSPHPDDEVLNLGGYITFAAARGDTLHLVAITDGEASSYGRRKGMSKAEVKRVRIGEQNEAWKALTNGRGKPIIRWGLPDAAVRPVDVQTRMAGLHRAVQERGKTVEYYLAGSSGDAHEDHRAAAKGANDGLHPTIPYRNSKAPGGTVGTRYKPVPYKAAHNAYLAYRPFGHGSVPALFSLSEKEGHTSRVVGYGR